MKMRYVKRNLLRRRAGEKELTFIEFMDSLSEEELQSLRKDAEAADQLRIAYNALRRGLILTSIKSICKSIKAKPGYVIDKLKHNILRVK
jgi:hypothetical protein